MSVLPVASKQLPTSKGKLVRQQLLRLLWCSTPVELSDNALSPSCIPHKTSKKTFFNAATYRISSENHDLLPLLLGKFSRQN